MLSTTTADLRHGVDFRFIVPIAGLMLGSLALVGGLLWLGSREQDDLGLKHERQLIEHAIASATADLAMMAKDYSWWDDTVRYLVLDFDPDWADANTGIYVNAEFGYEFSFVVDRGDRTTYAAIDGEHVAADAFASLTPGLGRLVEEARQAPADEPTAATGILRSEDGLVIVAASAITPEGASGPTLPPGPRTVLVFAQRLDEAFLRAAEEGYRVGGLRLVPVDGAAAAASVVLTAPTGAPLGQLTWAPARPGRELLHRILPGLGGALLLFTFFTGFVMRSIQRAAVTIRFGETRFRDIAEASSDWIWETDAELRVRFLSERFAAITGIGAESVLGRSLRELFHPAEDLARWDKHLADVAARRPFRGLLCHLDSAAGRDCTLRVAGKPIFETDGSFRGYRGTATDITVEIQAQSQAQFLAHHDAVTGLPNRVLLHDRLEQALAECCRCNAMAAVICIDLDRFKEVNDSLGHAAGDLLIKACAERFVACARESDTVARLGGDEFAIVQAGVERVADVQRLGDRLLAQLNQPFDLDGHEVIITASIGVAMVPVDGTEPGRLLQNADIALYRAKTEGRNRFRFFEPGMDAQLRERKALEADLRNALQNGELELHYQPQVELHSGALAGLEALVRWKHPLRGLVAPGDFILIAEETGLILPIGEWVLRTACVQALAWPAVRMSVNLSPIQFKHDDLVGMVREALEDSGLDPDRLELEITEGVLLHDTRAALLTLMELKELGVRIAMDDFGTGYSSLSYLQKFPFDKIKIDRSFVHDLDSGNDSEAIVKAVVGLGRSLGIETCAEGVEHFDQLRLLEGQGCDEVQGYLFSKPLPAAAIQTFIDRAAEEPPLNKMRVDRPIRRA